MSKAQYKEYKAIEEEAHARFEAKEEENEKALNKQHPQCVDWRARKVRLTASDSAPPRRAPRMFA